MRNVRSPARTAFLGGTPGVSAALALVDSGGAKQAFPPRTCQNVTTAGNGAQVLGLYPPPAEYVSTQVVEAPGCHPWSRLRP